MIPPPPDGNAVTLGEVYRGLHQLREDVHDDMEGLRQQIAGIQVVHPSTYAADQRAIADRLAALESFRDWALRLVVASVVTGLVALLFTTSGVSP